jgi:nicotinamidase-related amidase
MKRFTSMRHAQRLLSAFSGIWPHFSAPLAPAVGARGPTGDGRPLRGLQRDHRGDDHGRRLNRRLGQTIPFKPTARHPESSHRPIRLAQVDNAIAPAPTDVVIDKDGPDAFLDTDLADVLAEHRVRTLVIAGFATEACVDSTARSALSRGYDIVLVSDGHRTTSERGDHPVDAAEVIAHYNAIFSKIDYATRRIDVIPEALLVLGRKSVATLP